MKSFDYEQYRVVGLVENKFNGKIDVIGYCDDNYYVFNPLTSAEALELFPSKGKIFAWNFSLYHENLQGKIVCICVKPSSSNGTENYVWNSNEVEDVIEYGKRIFTIEGIFSNDGQHNFDILESNNLLDVNEEILVLCENRVYQIIPNNSENIINFWEITSLNIVTIDGIKYFVGISLPKQDGYIDTTTDEQLINWYLSKVVKKNWADIIKNKSFRNLEAFLTEMLTSMQNLDESILQCRLNRLKAINAKLFLPFDRLKEIAETPWFSDVVLKSIEDQKVMLLEQMEKENDLGLHKVKENYEVELLRLKKEQEKKIDLLRQNAENILCELFEQEKIIKERIEEKNLEIELLDETVKDKKQAIATLEESIDKLNNRKASIIQDFSIIHEVLNATDTSRTHPVNKNLKKFSLEEINFSDKPNCRFQAYIKSLENFMKANGAPKISPTIMGKMLAKYYVVLCPSLSIAQSFIFASHKCKYLTEYVSVKWTSFEDLWENGLAYIVSKSMEEIDTMHFLLLQNINLSYLPNFLQPLIDLQRGIISKFPVSDIPYPNNLRILCTVAEEELIKMPGSSLKYFGCIDKTFYFESLEEMKFADDASLGYLTPKELCNEREQNIEVQNMFEQYVDE